MNRQILLLLVLGSLSVLPAFAETQISDKVVVLQTNSGDIVIELFESDAPQTVSNFISLTEQEFYDETIFHRVIKDFMIQGGDPNTKDTRKIAQWGFGGSGDTIPDEFNTIMHKRGIVSLAKNNDPDSASSQFFIVHKDSPHLDQKYTVFGRLATQESYDTLDKIANLETTGPSTNYIPSDLFSATIRHAEVQKHDEIKGMISQGEPQRIAPVVTETLRPYSNEDLDISFDMLSTWTIQEIQKQDPRQPDIVVSGPSDPIFAPKILLFVKNSTATSLADFSQQTKDSYSKLIQDGSLVITGEEKTTINGKAAIVRDSNEKSTTSSETLYLQYRETVFEGDGKFYTLTYANTAENFDKHLPQYTNLINSLKIKESANSYNKDSGCLIATATYGSELAPQVQMLREIRDNVLFGTHSGTTFMTGFNEFYYSFSPTVADLERANPMFRELVRLTITPMLSSLSILNYVSSDTEQEMMAYGFGIIFLNVGIYFVAPTILLLKIKPKFGQLCHLNNKKAV